MNRITLGLTAFVAGLVVLPLVVFCYLKLGRPPVAVTDAAFPFERTIVHTPLKTRIEREMPSASPLQPTPGNLASGASIYRTNCASCHGLPNQPSVFAKHMYPAVPQLWRAHRNGAVGVSDDPVGETYWKVKNGIRLTGMPAYADILSEEQMWQVSLLLSSAAKRLPTQAQNELAVAADSR
jgi:thiosulfate dehydrogenase